MKTFYYYLFYKFYKISESAPSKWLSDWKASFLLDIVIYIVVIQLFIYYKIFINNDIHLNVDSNIELIIMVGSVVIWNYFIFHHRNNWKVIVAKFDNWPSDKKKIMNMLFFFFVLLLLFGLGYAFYTLSQITSTNKH